MSQKGKSIETESRFVVTWGWGWEHGFTVTGTRDLKEVMKISQNWIILIGSQHSKFTKNH